MLVTNPVPEELLSSVIAEPRQVRIAALVILLSSIAFVAAVPFARLPLLPVPAFIPAYEAALLIIDLITAVLLFGQFAQRRSAALLALAAGYLFDGLMMVPHALSFPGLVTPTGWLGAGAQTTAWLYMFWHGGFPLCVLAYVELSRRNDMVAGRAWPLISAVAAFAAAILLTLLATSGHDLLPEIMSGNVYTPILKFVVGAVWTLSIVTLLALLWHRPYTILNLWLVVVMFAWTFDIALSAVLNAGRFDLGFYLGRFYGLLAASFVLGVLLVETGALQTRLAAATAQLARDARELDRRVRARTTELTNVNLRLSAILEASPSAIFMLDPGGRVVLWTASAERVFGYTEAEALGRLPPYLTEEYMDDFRAILAHASSDAAATGFIETHRRRKDGTIIDASVRWARVNDETGRMLGIMYLIGNITARKRLERELHQAQKMQAVGTLAGGIAHDFNNLLGVIILNLDVLRERLGADSEADELTREASTAAMRGAELIRRLLAFSRRQPLQPQRSDINLLIIEITKLLERTLGEQMKIVLELDRSVWPTVVDPAQLEASLTNLATNARDAMPEGGALTIVTGNRYLDQDYASQHAEVVPGDYAMIEVSDSGSGMSPEVLAQVFEPFFTTKEPGKGTGLGLSMVYGFIKQSGGHINIYSELGVGTTVRLYLPRVMTSAGAEEQSAPSAPVRGGRETVLAVEDNPGLRRVVVRQLAELGYRVLEADNAGAAQRLLDQERVDVLFTDIVLPGGIGGFELARTVLARWPATKIVLTSGFPENRINNGDLPNVRLLGKPYRREDIARIVREVLDETQPAL